MLGSIRRSFGFFLGLAGLIPVVLLVLYLGAAQPGMANPQAGVNGEKTEPVESLYYTQLLTETSAFTVHLPLVMNNGRFCYFDDFSDPTSGWPTGNTTFGSTYYDQGVYRMTMSAIGGVKIFGGVSPDWIVPNDAVIKVDAWIDSPQSGAGILPAISLVFGLHTMPYQDQLIWIDWYEFRVSPDQQYYRIWKWRYSGGDYDYTVLTSGNSPAILPDSGAVQKLEVHRTDDAITLVINDTVLETVTDTTNPYTGNRSVGLGGGDFYLASFDNFEVTSITCMPGQ